MITFKELDIEGFCSIQRLSINLNKEGLNILKAPNGSGKTTIFSAFSWVLYGQTLKKKNKVNTWESYQPEYYRGTKVSIKFTKDDKEYQIIRCDSYKRKILGIKGKDRLFFIENSKERTDLRTKPQIQLAITELLGYTYDLFINSVIFGQKLKRIIQETGPNKKKVFDDAFEVDYLNKAKKVAVGRKEKVEERHHEIVPIFTALASSLKELEERLKAGKEAKKKFKVQKKDEIAVIKSKLRVQKKKVGDIEELKIRLKSFKVDFKAIEETKESINTLEKEKFKTELLLTQFEGKTIEYKDKINKFKEAFPLISKTCPRCNQRLDRAHLKKEREAIKREIKDYKDLSLGVMVAAKDLKLKLKGIEDQLSSYQDVNKDITRNKNHIRHLEANLKVQEDAEMLVKQYKKQIHNIKIRKFTINIKSLKKKVYEVNEQLIPIIEENIKVNRELETYKWLIKVPLSNSGIKAFIFDYMIGLVNEQLENYEKIIGFRINFSIDMETVKRDFVTTISRKGSIQNYDDLSGGEQQLVDVALAFAIHDVTSLEKDVNVLMLDEVFESLDVTNVEIVQELVQQKAKDKALWLITHLDTFNPSGSNIIRLENRKGNTKLVE